MNPRIRPQVWLSATVLALILSGCGPAVAPPSDEEASDLMGQAWEELAGGKQDSSECSGVVPPDSAPFDYRVALTFDDGPSLRNTPQVMDILEKHGAFGTFFINGKGVTSQAQMDLLKEMRDRGHIVGNHSQNHANCAKLSSQGFFDEVNETERIIEEATGEKPRFFRYPYGAGTCATNKSLQQQSYAWVGWHVDSADWCFAHSADGYCSPRTFKWVPDALRHDFKGFILQQAKAKMGGIFLFHDIHKFTLSQLDGVLSSLEEAGFSFVRLDDTDAFPRLNTYR